MENKYCIDGITREERYVDARIADSPYGYKIIVPIFNEAVPSYYKRNVMKTIEAFMEAYAMSYGAALNPEDIYVDGNLSVCLDTKIPVDKKYRLYVVIIVESGVNTESQDYVIEIPVLPSDIHFGEFRQCILNVFNSMIENR